MRGTRAESGGFADALKNDETIYFVSCGVFLCGSFVVLSSRKRCEFKMRRRFDGGVFCGVLADGYMCFFGFVSRIEICERLRYAVTTTNFEVFDESSTKRLR